MKDEKTEEKPRVLPHRVPCDGLCIYRDGVECPTCAWDGDLDRDGLDTYPGSSTYGGRQ